MQYCATMPFVKSFFCNLMPPSCVICQSNLHTNKPSLSAARSSKRPLEEYSESEKEESEYESEGEEIERSPMGAREDEQENEDDYEEEVDEEAADAISPSEEEEVRLTPK